MPSQTPDSDTEFALQVRAYLRDMLPADMAKRGRTDVHPSREDQLGITALLAGVGWSVPNWPVEYGGPGWSAQRRMLFEEELMLAGAPPNNIQGVSLVAPVVYTFGTEAQKARYLAPIREGREFWAQGFSEPGSGSDLASLRTRAVLDGDGPDAVYVVNGQKIWTSDAFMADMLFTLVRTDPLVKAQRGISFLLIALNSPGVTVRTIPSIDEGESLCEVFFDDVRVPVANLIGEEGRGWDYAKFLLGTERVGVAEVPRNKRNLATLATMAAQAPSGTPGISLYADPVFRSRIARLEIDLLALEAAAVQTLAIDDQSPLTPSALKIHGTELMQAILGLQVETLGGHAGAFYPHDAAGPSPGPEHAPGVTAEYLFRRCMTILGGSNEIQKNIIAKLLFSGQQPSLPTLSEDQLMLQQSAERCAADYRDAPWSDRADGDPARAHKRWRKLADTGLLGLGIAEDIGGYGGSDQDLAVLCETLGGVTEPLGTCAIAPGLLLARSAWSIDRQRAVIQALVAGEQVVAFAHAEAESAGQGAAEMTACRAQASAGGFRLDGAKCAVAGGPIADAFIVSARSAGQPGDAGGLSLFWLPRNTPGLTCLNYRSIDGQVLADLRLDGVALDEDALLSPLDQALPAIEHALDLLTTMACAGAVGTMDQLLTLTRDYLQTRQQFGAPLASFQALQHRVAEMYGEIALSRALVQRAVAALAGGPAPRALLAAAAKSRTGRAGFFVGSQAVQLHGGIGMTQACAVGGHFKHLHMFEASWGNSQYQSQRFARLTDSNPAVHPRDSALT
jgi:acyl-CoA dehydrogenase